MVVDAAQVDGLSPTVGDHIGGGLRITLGKRVFARMVVAGAGRDDAQRNVAERQRLQRKRNDTVAAAHHQRVGASRERIVDQPARVIGVGADDFADVDAALLETGDRPLGRMRCVAVARHRISQHRDAGDIRRLAPSHGISLPGLRIPAGSSVALTARSTATPRSPTSSRIHGRWSAPTA